MSKKPSDLTPIAQKGYGSITDTPPYIPTSPNWFAFKIGLHLRTTGRTAPRDVRMGRGYTIHANGILFEFDGRNAIRQVK